MIEAINAMSRAHQNPLASIGHVRAAQGHLRTALRVLNNQSALFQLQAAAASLDSFSVTVIGLRCRMLCNIPNKPWPWSNKRGSFLVASNPESWDDPTVIILANLVSPWDQFLIAVDTFQEQVAPILTLMDSMPLFRKFTMRPLAVG